MTTSNAETVKDKKATIGGSIQPWPHRCQDWVAINASRKAEDNILPAVRTRHPTLEHLDTKYKNAVQDLSQELTKLLHKFRLHLGDDIPETARADANRQYISIPQLRYSMQNEEDKLVPQMERNAEAQ